MKLTITKKPFKGNPVGSDIEMNGAQAKLLVKLGRAQYQTRMMTAETPVQVVAPAAEPVPEPAAAPAEPEVFVTAPAEREKRQYIRRRPFDTPTDGQTE